MVQPDGYKIFLFAILCVSVFVACDPSSSPNEEETDSRSDDPSDGDLHDDTGSSPKEGSDTFFSESDSTENTDPTEPNGDGGFEADTDSDSEQALYVDVRTAEEYAMKHYPGALNIPWDSLVDRQSELFPKDRWIIVYCASGKRSAKAKAILEQEGFSNVEDGGALDTLSYFFPIRTRISTPWLFAANSGLLCPSDVDVRKDRAQFHWC